jgi:hypothetical protein
LPFSGATGTNCHFSSYTVSQSNERRRCAHHPEPPSAVPAPTVILRMLAAPELCYCGLFGCDVDGANA